MAKLAEQKRQVYGHGGEEPDDRRMRFAYRARMQWLFDLHQLGLRPAAQQASPALVTCVTCLHGRLDRYRVTPSVPCWPCSSMGQRRVGGRSHILHQALTDR